MFRSKASRFVFRGKELNCLRPTLTLPRKTSSSGKCVHLSPSLSVPPSTLVNLNMRQNVEWCVFIRVSNGSVYSGMYFDQWGVSVWRQHIIRSSHSSTVLKQMSGVHIIFRHFFCSSSIMHALSGTTSLIGSSRSIWFYCARWSRKNHPNNKCQWVGPLKFYTTCFICGECTNAYLTLSQKTSFLLFKCAWNWTLRLRIGILTDPSSECCSRCMLLQLFPVPLVQATQ